MNTFDYYLTTIGEYGVITEVEHPLVTIEGLPKVKPNEVVMFEDGTIGQVFSMSTENVILLTFSQSPLKPGMQVVRTNELLSISMSETILGQAIDPLGNQLTMTDTPHVTTDKNMQAKRIDITPPGIGARSRIKKPLVTGTSIVDMLIPIGKGQRELIIGDRKTGKTAFLLDTLLQQTQEGTLAIYAAIGKKKNDIKDLQNYFQEKNIADKVVLVATNSYDNPSLVYMTPYTAMTIAEYFRDIGKDTVVILDDLSTHAKFYREISLLAKNFPGRDSYPGDIFHAHARLLERAGNFLVNNNDVSITCLPVVETIEGNFTSYIPTNIMSMTDGHIYFDTNILSQGRRPAINSMLSVTRVGKQIHTPLLRSLNRELLALLTLYEKVQNLSHFGGELSDQMKYTLTNGELFYRYFNQPENFLIPLPVQIVFLALLWIGVIKQEDLEKQRSNLLENAKKQENSTMLQQCITGETFNDLLRNVQQQKEALQALCK